MSFLAKLFGKDQPEETKSAPPESAVPPSDPSKDPNMIRVYDSYGRELFIPKEQWREKVLPGSVKDAWSKPDELYSVIFSALHDGFRSDVVDAAKQLYAIDPDRVRGACVWGIVLKDEGRFDEAEKVFRDFMAKHGENGVVLTNLAKVYAKRKDDRKAEELLWHALELDPNQDNGMGWYEVIHREREGEPGSLAALRRIAALPCSWRAQLWLARSALKSRELERALTFYKESLSHAGEPVPPDLLYQMSGDLGQAGHLPELLALTEPHFNAESHGLLVGNNLIKAHVDLGQLEAAQRILDQLYSLKRPDWKASLSFWDTEIAKARVGTTNLGEQKPLKITMLTGDGPVRLRSSSPAAELFPAKPPDGLVICFLGSSVDIATNSQRTQHKLSDAPGRLSRALPLFLAEQVDFGSLARVQTFVPWIAQATGGFVACGVPWKDDDAAAYARQGELKGDYVVISHIKSQSEPWILELRLVRALDGKCLGTLSASFPSTKPQEALPDLVRRLLALLSEQAEVDIRQPPTNYQVPTAMNFPDYLLRLEQLLAVRCGSMHAVSAGFLNGEREILDGNLQLCLACPESVSLRILFAQTLLAMKRVRPDILPEFKEKIALLQKEKPLPEPAHSLVQRMLNEVAQTSPQASA